MVFGADRLGERERPGGGRQRVADSRPGGFVQAMLVLELVTGAGFGRPGESDPAIGIALNPAKIEVAWFGEGDHGKGLRTAPVRDAIVRDPNRELVGRR